MTYRPIVCTLRGTSLSEQQAMLSDLSTLPLSLVLLFAAEGARLTPLSAALSQELGPNCLILGCSSAGGFAFDGYDDDSVIVVGFPAGAFRAEAIWLSRLRQHMALDWMLALRALSDRFQPAPRRSAFGLLLIDGMSGREELVTTTVSATLPEIMVLGGSAGDGLRFGRTRLAMNGEERSESAIFCMIETDFAIEEVVFDHFVPVGARMVVTEADPDLRLISEINGEPAAMEYARLIGMPEADLGPAAYAENPLLERSGGRHFVRAISGVTPRRELTLMSSVETGAILTLGRPTGLTEGLRTRMERLGPAHLVLGFDCILRRIAIERAGEERQLGQLCRDFRIAGFNTYGEQHGGIHVNQTFVGLAFLPRTGNALPHVNRA